MKSGISCCLNMSISKCVQNPDHLKSRCVSTIQNPEVPVFKSPLLNNFLQKCCYFEPYLFFQVAHLLTYKTTHNEFSALSFLTTASKLELNKRNSTLAFYLICNTIHPVGLGMTLATLVTAIPLKRKEIMRCVTRAILGAILASFLTTAIIGTLLGVDV